MEKPDNRMEKNQENRATRGFPTVDHKPARCPNCGSTRTDVRSTQRPVESVVKRYHGCKNCDVTFNSQQVISPDEIEERQKPEKPEKTEKKKS